MILLLWISLLLRHRRCRTYDTAAAVTVEDNECIQTVFLSADGTARAHQRSRRYYEQV